jgi:Glycosyl hydrolase family 26
VLLLVAAVAAGTVAGFKLGGSGASVIGENRPPGGNDSGSGDETQSEPPRPMAGKLPAAPGRKAYWGAFRLDAPYRRGLVRDLESDVHDRPAILMWYQEWAGTPDFPIADADWLYERGIVPMVTWEPWKPPKTFGAMVVDQPKYRLRRIADGALDDYIVRYAEKIKEFRGPVMIRPFHEMDGFWYPWGGLVNGNTPADFVQAWRHIHDLFDHIGATNVTWVWSVNHLSVPDTPENSIDRYWPGRRYVDWIGISGFNWGTASSVSRWETFSELYAARLRSLRHFHKPVMLTELGAAESGGDKASWIADTFATIHRDYPHIDAFVWYDKRDSDLRDWRIGSSDASQNAFSRALRAHWILSAPRAFEATTPPGA